MPISDQPTYEQDHFRRVYEDIFKPAIKDAGFEAKRADDTREANIIHLDILKELLDAPMAICDLSSRNPNVMFELGIRQAFDKPVILIKDGVTPNIFDLSLIRHCSYNHNMKFIEVIKAREELTKSIMETANKSENNVNSLVRLLEISGKAKIPSMSPDERSDLKYEQIMVVMQNLSNQVNQVQSLINRNASINNYPPAALAFYNNNAEYPADNNQINNSLTNPLLGYLNKSFGQSSNSVVIDQLGKIKTVK